MTPWLKAAGFVLLAGALPVPLSAQWPRHKEAGAPRAADGKVNLSAPAPRTPDGKPDLSGVWENIGWREGAAASDSVSGTGGAPGSRSAESRRPPAPSIAMFFDIGSGVPGGLPFQPWARELKSKRTAENAKDNPDAHCLPLGNMQLHLHPEPRKIIQVAETDRHPVRGQRRRAPDLHRRPDAAAPRRAAVVVRLLDREVGGRHACRRNERIPRRRVARREREPVDRGRENDRTVPARQLGTLELELTVDDPKAYTRPWTVKVTQRLMPDDELIEFVCQENELSSAHFK